MGEAVVGHTFWTLAYLVFSCWWFPWENIWGPQFQLLMSPWEQISELVMASWCVFQNFTHDIESRVISLFESSTMLGFVTWSGHGLVQSMHFTLTPSTMHPFSVVYWPLLAAHHSLIQIGLFKLPSLQLLIFVIICLLFLDPTAGDWSLSCVPLSGWKVSPPLCRMKKALETKWTGRL